MIDGVYVCRDGLLRLTLQGHAGAAPRGEDLVCAAATALCYALAATLEEPLVLSLEPGLADIAAPATHTARIAFRTVVNGLELLEGEYPDCIRIEELSQ